MEERRKTGSRTKIETLFLRTQPRTVNQSHKRKHVGRTASRLQMRTSGPKMASESRLLSQGSMGGNIVDSQSLPQVHSEQASYWVTVTWQSALFYGRTSDFPS